VNDRDASPATADELARVLNGAFQRGVCVIPYTDREGTLYSIEWAEGGTLRSRTVDWDPNRKRWLVADEEDRPGAAKRTASDWCAHYGIVVHGADGWKGDGAPEWTDPITLVDFADRIARSSIQGQLRRLMDDAAKAGRP
jgi:hypothetical protein